MESVRPETRALEMGTTTDRTIDSSLDPVRSANSLNFGALRESKERYRTLFELAPVAVYSCDASGVIREYNRRAAELWGRSPQPGDTDERFCGSFKMYRPDGSYMPHEQCPMGDVLTGKVPGVHDGEVVVERPDGSRVIVIVNIAPLTDDQGKVTGAINCFYDVTERKNFERDRETLLANERASRMEAEEANRSKDIFLATLSHEVRTPLTAMLGWATILRKKQCTEQEVREGAEVIERNCRAQAQLLEDVLEVSRIVTGKLRLEVKPCDLASVIYAAIDVVRPAANAKQITVTAAIDPGASPAVCDDVRIQQVVWNLLSNAIKFTPKGGRVHVALDREESQSRITISDNGQGIEPDLLPYVFDRFWQGDSSARRKLGGLGLGLSIVKHIVEHHGGTVEARSDGDGRGATFVVRLPIQAVQIASSPTDLELSEGEEGSDEQAAPERQERSRTDIHLSGVRILVVDDEADALRLVGKVLVDAGASIETAGSVREAIAAIEKELPHVLISDLGMPDEDGFDLVQWVRDAGHTAERLPVVALTAFANKGHERSALLGGFQIHVPKPVDPDHLIAVVASLATRQQSSR